MDAPSGAARKQSHKDALDLPPVQPQVKGGQRMPCGLVQRPEPRVGIAGIRARTCLALCHGQHGLDWEKGAKAALEG
ncbi:MAG TPA: hypothetical protein PK490_12580 [Prosthecobacter sp.]|nr:hypothetical protein [Prosthecobacter sp.]HRK15122.1 hypothetical protein [Prosthecobacter sp.]